MTPDIGTTRWEHAAREAARLLANCEEARLMASHLESRAHNDPTKALLLGLVREAMDERKDAA